MAMATKISSTLEDILTNPIHLIEQVRSEAQQVGSYRVECTELTTKADKLAKLLRAVARLDSPGVPLYTRPLSRMLQELEKALNKAVALIRRCKKKGMIRRVITITSERDFKRVSNHLENSIADLTWFLTVSALGSNRNEGLGGMPPITSSEPLLGFCWNQIALLHRGTDEEKEEAVISLNDYAKNNERFMKIMVEEEAVQPILKVLQEGSPIARVTAARTLGQIAKDETVVKQMVAAGVVPVFVKVLANSPMKIQVAIAWTISEMLNADPKQQDLFLEHGAVRPLVALLGESLEDPERIRSPAVTNIGTLVSSVTGKKAGAGFKHIDDRNRFGKTVDSSKGLSQREINRRERENADPVLKAQLKAEVARAIWKMAAHNPTTCKSITETKALLCFATLMEKATDEVQYNSVMAVTEIAAVAENDVELRRTAFKMSSPAAKAVVDQLLRLVEEGSTELQVPCIRAIGCLSRTFPVRETKVVKPLVKQLEGPDDVVAEAVKALVKFACKDNFLHKEHSKQIVDAGGAGPLVQLIYFSKGDVQIAAVTLMCCLALHSGENATLAKAEPLPALKGFQKTSTLLQDPEGQTLLQQAINHLEIYHGRQPRDLAEAVDYDTF